MRLLIKLLFLFASIYAVASLMRGVRIRPSFSFLALALIGLMGTIGDRILLPRFSRAGAAVGDALFAALGLFGAAKWNRDSENRVTWPYIGVLSALLGGFEYLYHGWIYNREAYKPESEQRPDNRPELLYAEQHSERQPEGGLLQ